MAKPSSNLPEKQTWGTWEELLLACAVHRYGTDGWDSVAAEVQKRTSSLKTLTGLSCKQKYHDLKVRFSQYDAASKPETNNINNNNIPWLEELRKLRVAELKREVERYDLSIVSLQSKVNRLKEEREQSLRDEEEEEAEKLDLEKMSVEIERETEEHEEEEEEEKHKDGEPDNGEGGEESDRENRSVNESNSTDPKSESPGTGQGEAEKEAERTEPDSDEPGRDCEGIEVKPEVVEDSCNSVAEELARNSERVDPAEVGESVAESKEIGGSDVQSSASLSRSENNNNNSNNNNNNNEKKNNKVEEEPDEPDGERSPAIKIVSVESQPLIDLLEIIRSHKLSSFFERRLETQETPNYTNLIRQHIDLQTIQRRLEEGWYSGCKDKFFRDLLLLFNNAIVFFEKKSPETLAAVELRELVSMELTRKMPTPEPLPKEESLVPQDPEPSRPLAVKPKMRVLMIACRKRSAIATKASPLFSGADKKGSQKANSMEEKPVIDLKQQDKSTDKAEDNPITKKRTRERSTSGARNLNSNSKSRTSTKTNKNSDANSNPGLSSKAGSQSEDLDSKVEKEKRNSTNTSSKRKGAANFLDRMKRSSPCNNGPLLESLKQHTISSDHSKETEQKRNRSNARKDQNSRKGSGGKQTRERGNLAKKNVGRPPKRAAAPSPLVVVPSKRVREAGGTEASASGHAKKRSRK